MSSLRENLESIFNSKKTNSDKLSDLELIGIIGKFLPDGRFTGQQLSTHIWIWHNEEGKIETLVS
jgi:hypothetical protein|tara:strand:+ start:203 stop:397 length:195 start_codon:yes stop_codon:yes gene_type:complete